MKNQNKLIRIAIILNYIFISMVSQAQVKFVGFSDEISDSSIIIFNKKDIGYIEQADTIIIIGCNAVYYYKIIDVCLDEDGMKDFIGGSYMLGDSIYKFATHYARGKLLFSRFHNNWLMTKEICQYLGNYNENPCFIGGTSVKFSLYSHSSFSDKNISIQFLDKIYIENNIKYRIESFLKFETRIKGYKQYYFLLVVENPEIDNSRYFAIISYNLAGKEIAIRKISYFGV